MYTNTNFIIGYRNLTFGYFWLRDRKWHDQRKCVRRTDSTEEPGSSLFFSNTPYLK